MVKKTLVFFNFISAPYIICKKYILVIIVKPSFFMPNKFDSLA